MVNKQVNSGDLRYAEDATRTILSQAIMKRTYPAKKCVDCGTEFTPKGPAAKFCLPCAERNRKLRDIEKSQRFRITQGVRVGAGKGGANTIFSNDSQFHSGISHFKKRRCRQIKTERRYCERCGEDLLDAGLGQWCVHHKDHDRTNNVDSNFELLCKRCHQLEHDCAANLPN